MPHVVEFTRKMTLTNLRENHLTIYLPQMAYVWPPGPRGASGLLLFRICHLIHISDKSVKQPSFTSELILTLGAFCLRVMMKSWFMHLLPLARLLELYCRMSFLS